MDADGGHAALPFKPGGARTIASPRQDGFVPESRFGFWFLNTQTWSDYVLKVALRDLRRMMDQPEKNFPVMLDVGCGHGRSLPLLAEAFRPARLLGLDREPRVLANARPRAAKIGPMVTLIRGDCTTLPLAAGSVDLIFCHQILHHLVPQAQALREFHRVLRPGGVLLLAESTRAYIEWWIIRLLFRHPMHVQRTAGEFLAMVRACGFVVTPDAISYPYLWWSRTDLGIPERVLRIPPPPTGRREETLLNVVAVKAEPE